MFDLEDITPLNSRDILAALPDGVSLAMGAAVRTPHPFADLIAGSPLRIAAYAAGVALAPRRAGETEIGVVGRGLRTTEFAGAIAAALQDAARRTFDAQAQHRGVVAEVEVKRLGTPEPVGAVDLSTPFTDVGDGREYGTSRATLRDGEEITMTSLGRVIEIPRESIFNDDLDLLRDAIAETGVAAARLESRLVAAALETTGNLSDGNPVFDVFGNWLPMAAMEITSPYIDNAMVRLRIQPAADGHPLDAAAAAMLVSPSAEYTARRAVFEAGLPIEVRCLAGLPYTHFYLLAGPRVARNIAVARLAGQTHPLAVEAVRTPLQFDGARVRVRIDTGAAMVGRLGIVRVAEAPESP